MQKKQSLIQVSILIAFALVAALINWACGGGGGYHPPSDSGSSHTGPSGQSEKPSGSNLSKARLMGEGVLENWHDFYPANSTQTGKNLDYLKNLMQNHMVFGLQVPTAPGASQPGVLSGTHDVFFSYYGKFFTIPLTPSQQSAAEIAAIFPADPGTHWQALIAENDAWQSQVPTYTKVFTNMSGSLHYTIDFMGSDACNGCEIKLTSCSDINSFLPGVFENPLGIGFLSANAKASPSGLVCRTPVSTIVNISDFDINGNIIYPPGPLVAAFGFYGGPIYNSTISPTIDIRVPLRHTSPTTETFTLSAIGSTLGWTYQWKDELGNPITQIDIAPRPKHWNDPIPTIHLTADNLPTCTSLQDTLYLTATMVTTPTVKAYRYAIVEIKPDPTKCVTADVGVWEIASHEAISAGQWVTYTFTISNFETNPVSAVFTKTLSSAAAIADAKLPEGCTRSGAAITCQVVNIPASNTQTLTIGIQVATGFSGILANEVQIQPLNAADGNQYDNKAARSLSVSKPPGSKLYLPYVSSKTP